MLSSPSPPGVSGRAVRVSLSVRVSAGPGFGPGQPGQVRVRPTGAVARASLGRCGCDRQSVSRPDLRVGHGVLVGTVLEPFMRTSHVFA
jgi:hypothetical protein